MTSIGVKSSGGAREFAKRMLEIRKRLEDIQPALPDVHDAFIHDEHELFNSAGATGEHGAWPPNKPVTISAKGHAQILFGKPAKGFRLKSSLTNRADPDHIFRTTPTSVVMGTRHWKAHIHAKGKGRNPIRRPVDPTRFQKQHYVDIISTYIVEGGARA